MKKNPDAELFAMRDRCAELWEQTMSLDKRTIDLRRAGKLSGGPMSCSDVTIALYAKPAGSNGPSSAPMRTLPRATPRRSS
jgi:hypothetical protein